MKKKNLVLAGLFALTAFGMAIQSFATTRNSYMVPVNQTGAPDTYALPCTPKHISAVANSAVVPLLALDEAGMVYWVSFQAVTAADYVVLRDSATANASSTELWRGTSLAVTDTKMIQFNPPMAVVNGLSINVSSQTMVATVCVREADGDLK